MARWFSLLVLFFLVASAAAQHISAYKSPLGLAIDRHGKRAYVALHTAAAVAEVDLTSGKVIREIPVGRGPFDLAQAGDNLFVSCELDDALVRIDLKKNTVVQRWRVGQAPRGVVALPGGRRVLVACHDDKIICAIDVATGKVFSVGVPGWPERLALDNSLDHAHVLALLRKPGEALVAEIGNTDAKAGPSVLFVSRLRDVSNARGLATPRQAFPSGLIALQKPRTKVPATQISQGWVFTNILSPLALKVANAYPESGPKMLDEPNRGFADPSDVVVTALERHAFVACAGADTVLALRTGPFQKDKQIWAYSSGDDLTASRHYVVARLATQANPRRLTLSDDGKILVAANYLGDSLTVMDAEKMRVLRHIPLGGAAPDAARRGEILFNSNKMTFHGQFTCASCHPNGGADGLDWDLSRDGIGNPMNTRSLLGVKDTAPYGWLGNSLNLADRVSGTLRTLHHHEPQGTEVADIVAYLKALPPPRPLPQGAADAPAIARGRALFEGKGKCMNCHRRAALDDDTGHDVGSRIQGDHQDQFDTPSLRGVARTAPYLHHGQAKTLEEIFMTYNPLRRHGAAHRLTPAELADVIIYLKSL
jgi:DNA-binding beta-propeller fold protein YncE